MRGFVRASFCFIVTLALTIVALPGFGALTVKESADERGVFSIWRDGVAVVADIRAEIEHSATIQTSYCEKLGARIWNRWCENREDNFRFEVVERADGAIELTMVGHCDTPIQNRRRGISFSLPAERFTGKSWQAKLGDRRSGKEGNGVFSNKFKAFTTRFLATDGLVFDLDALGPGIYTSNSHGVTGEWTVSSDGKGGARVSGVSFLPHPKSVSIRTALVYEGELSKAVEGDGYFDALVPIEKLLGK